MVNGKIDRNAVAALVADMRRPFSKPVSDKVLEGVMHSYCDALRKLVGDASEFSEIFKDFNAPVRDYAGRINSPDWVNSCLEVMATRIMKAAENDNFNGKENE